MNILLLEDDASIAEALEQLLEDLGYKVLYAYDIDDAQEYIENEQIDIIITDLNMAGDGLKEDEYRETLEGTLSGFIWLKNYALVERPELSDKTIIFSAYITELEEKFSKEDLADYKIISKEVTMDDKIGILLNTLKSYENE